MKIGTIEVGTENMCLVGIAGPHVTMLSHKSVMTKTQALNLAAWLYVIATLDEPPEREEDEPRMAEFANLVTAIENT